jgi:hypothetical protein
MQQSELIINPDALPPALPSSADTSDSNPRNFPAGNHPEIEKQVDYLRVIIGYFRENTETLGKLKVF